MMSPGLILASIGLYFAAVYAVAWLANRGRAERLETFFVADRRAPWLLVSFGMIGTTLSGVTFISVPGAVAASGMGYMQVALGYTLGYLVIARVLLPLYYRTGVTSIYQYLQQRFGRHSHRAGAWLFLVSRLLGSAARLYLMAIVLQFGICEPLGVPFWLQALLTVVVILGYSAKGGLRTIIWTDVFQTAFMLLAVGLTMWEIMQTPGIGSVWETIAQSPYNQLLFLDDPAAPNFFWKQLVGGAFIAIVMTGLDQDMMQKNLSIRSLRQSQWNVLLYSIVLVFVNLLFVGLGVLLYAYADAKGIAHTPQPDQMYPLLAFGHFGPLLGVMFVLGLIAAALGGADSSLTALTTSFCVDVLKLPAAGSGPHLRTKRRVHWGMALLTLLLVLLFRESESWREWRGDSLSVIDLVLRLATYTYGPLLGLFAFGLFTRLRIHDRLAPLVCLVAPLATLLLQSHSEAWFGGYVFGFELLLLNAGLTFAGLLAIARRTAGLAPMPR